MSSGITPAGAGTSGGEARCDPVEHSREHVKSHQCSQATRQGQHGGNYQQNAMGFRSDPGYCNCGNAEHICDRQEPLTRRTKTPLPIHPRPVHYRSLHLSYTACSNWVEFEDGPARRRIGEEPESLPQLAKRFTLVSSGHQVGDYTLGFHSHNGPFPQNEIPMQSVHSRSETFGPSLRSFE